AAVAAAVLFAGCSAIGKLAHLEVGPDYARPTVEPPAEFRGQVAPAEAASIADLPWWKVFGDPVLQRLIGEAVENNYDLQTAVARVEQFRAQVGVAASELYPQVGYEGQAQRGKTFVPIGTTGNLTSNVFAGLLQVAWELDVWGRIRRSTEAAHANFLASEDAQRGVLLILVSDVATAYFRLLELDRQLEIARTSGKTYRRTLDLFTQRYEGGKDTKISTSRAEASLASSLATVAVLEREILQQENAINQLRGADPGPIARGTPLTAQAMPATPPGLTTDLLQRRPDIMQAEHGMVSANAEIGVAIASFFPTIGLSALYGGESPKIGDIVKNSFSVWNVAGNVSGPIFQGGRLLEEYHAQKAFWDETVARYRGTIIQAFRETSDALAAQAKLVEQRAAQERQVAALGQAVELSLLRYRTGLANYFEVLEAEQQLYPAEDALAQAQRDQLLAVVGLYKALGGGWQTNAQQPQVARHSGRNP
ncbi:MAG: outer membrane protein multidrug efflux system, partial [Candidatus Binatota bacterium]|nr:outer membrane protein multidrug efflux system [Candidatus Binatota bacterium]